VPNNVKPVGQVKTSPNIGHHFQGMIYIHII